MIKDYQDQVLQIKKDLDEKKRAIKNNRLYNEGGKADMIREAVKQANEKIQALKAEFYQKKEARIAELRSSLFGIGHKLGATPADKEIKMLSYRDAVSRAEALLVGVDTGLGLNGGKAKEALGKALVKAERMGDALMIQALGFVAKNNGLNSVAAAVAKSNGYGEEFAELLDLEAPIGDKPERYIFSLASF